MTTLFDELALSSAPAPTSTDTSTHSPLSSPAPTSTDTFTHSPLSSPTRVPSRRRPTKKTMHYRTATALLDAFYITLYTPITTALSQHPACTALSDLAALAADVLNARGDRCFIYKAGENVAYDADLPLLRLEIEAVRWAWETLGLEECMCEGCDVVGGLGEVDEGVVIMD